MGPNCEPVCYCDHDVNWQVTTRLDFGSRPFFSVDSVTKRADSESTWPLGADCNSDAPCSGSSNATVLSFDMDYSTISDEIRKLIEATVREHLVGYDVAPCNIELVDDEPGTVGISVGICYFSAGPPIHPRATLALVRALRDNLVAAGDWRMPFVEHYFTEDQKFEGLRRAC